MQASDNGASRVPTASEARPVDRALRRAAERVADAAERNGARLTKRSLTASLRADGHKLGRPKVDALWAHLEERAAASHSVTAPSDGASPGRRPVTGHSEGGGEQGGEERQLHAGPELPRRDEEVGRRPWWATLVTVAVGLVAAAASYGHMRALALEAGEPEWVSFLIPVSVDGLVLAALVSGRRGRWWLALALLASLGANVASAEPTLVGALVAGWPPIALAGVHHLLTQREPLSHLSHLDESPRSRGNGWDMSQDNHSVATQSVGNAQP